MKRTPKGPRTIILVN